MTKKRKHRSPAWEQARAERRARRQRLPEQARNEDGYIVKTIATPGGGTRQVLYDPGEMDRELYLQQRRRRERDSWEAPNA